MRLATWSMGSSRRALLACILALAGCMSSGSSGCDVGYGNGGLKNGNFAYLCTASGRDAQCSGGYSQGIPDAVIVGARFKLSYVEATAPDAQPAIFALRAASANRADESSDGFAIEQPGYAAFLVTRNGQVVDFVNLRARHVDQIQLTPSPFGSLAKGETRDLEVTPYGLSMVLGGALDCTFASSNAAIASVTTDNGRLAHVTGEAVGKATLTVTCDGFSESRVLDVSGTTPTLDASADAADAADAASQDAGGQ
ncbi:MAG TPA: Ig-like domain-containing protein [Polyangiaceae bacterium]